MAYADTPVEEKSRPQIVIVGGGFGGISAAKALAGAEADVTIIDRRNHHLFQPLLYQVATAALGPSQIASPIRSILRRQRNANIILDEALHVDRARREVILRDRTVPFDYLILATGAEHAYFGHDEWAAYAPGLKTLSQAGDIRDRILSSFEAAERASDAGERSRLLSFVIVGGGPTGVELAGAIAELARRALSCDFRRTRCEDPKVYLIEAGPRLLPSFSEPISDYVRRALEKRGVTVRLGTAVSRCDDAGVDLGDERIPSATIVWAAGVKASPAGRWLGSPTDRAGRVSVRPDLSIEADPRIFVIGDAAHAIDPDGGLIPGVAPAAKQQGAYVGRMIARRLKGQFAAKPFRYMDFGSLATVGRSSAVAEFGKIRLTGFPAWVFWSIVHIYFLIGFRNRVLITLDWIWSYLTLERGARIIVNEQRPPSAPALIQAPAMIGRGASD